ncbi:AAA family ATPase [Bradyrhizobium sp. NBAIM08]|uniref:AAA family ATPase n=1 Tax=Bradyrhizobium sp. NBAIM08 TaxID=2793815 RepID=UPI001CD2049A
MISGCPGCGKSTLLTELGRRGYATIDEPGRPVVRKELESGVPALPGTGIEARLHSAFDLSLENPTRASAFDAGFIRSRPDRRRSGSRTRDRRAGDKELGQARHYHRRVFIASALAGHPRDRSRDAS